MKRFKTEAGLTAYIYGEITREAAIELLMTEEGDTRAEAEKEIEQLDVLMRYAITGFPSYR